MGIARIAVIGAAALAATAAALTGAQAAGADTFSVTANGVANRGSLADLAPSSQVTMAVSNLPANVGLYAFHCLVPPPGASPVPTRCDAGTGTLMYIVAATAPQTTTRPLTVNAEFEGKNPNPQTGDTGTTAVNCRVDACAIYTLGAGRDSVNPAYVTTFRTQFAEVGPRAKDWATATIRGQVIKGAWQPRVSRAKASPFVVTMRSGLTATLASDACQVSQAGVIRALKSSGTCTVTITSPGTDEWAPFEREISFRLTK
ncbi:MAG: hypothetical protein FJW85_02820 [Actinobacteria bacterium]|nr:hypothetical protein [Actinomycetota bacterium]